MNVEVYVQAIIKLAIRYRFNLPPYYTLIVRSLCSLEGLALRVEPTFSIVNAAIPIILRRLLTDTRPVAVSLLRELLLDDKQRLRIGMLEGLLKNYSTEAGKSMQDSAAANVVLKGVGLSGMQGSNSTKASKLVPASAAANVVLKSASASYDASEHSKGLGLAPSRSASARHMRWASTATHQSEGSTAVAEPLVAKKLESCSDFMHTQGVVRLESIVDEEDKLRLGHSPLTHQIATLGDRSLHRHGTISPDSDHAAATAHASMHADAARLEAVGTSSVGLEAISDSARSHGRAREIGGDLSGGNGHADGDLLGRNGHADGGSAGVQPAAKAVGVSLEAQVIKMVLSAGAAGVRRVLLEADLKVSSLSPVLRTILVLFRAGARHGYVLHAAGVFVLANWPEVGRG
jgi:hypothetical protein